MCDAGQSSDFYLKCLQDLQFRQGRRISNEVSSELLIRQFDSLDMSAVVGAGGEGPSGSKQFFLPSNMPLSRSHPSVETGDTCGTCRQVPAMVEPWHHPAGPSVPSAADPFKMSGRRLNGVRKKKKRFLQEFQFIFLSERGVSGHTEDHEFWKSDFFQVARWYFMELPFFQTFSQIRIFFFFNSVFLFQSLLKIENPVYSL